MTNNDKAVGYVYSVVERDIEAQISSGALAAGSCIPSENELSRKYKISRMSARQAITNLVSRKLLYRVAGKGTFIAASKGNEAVSLIGLVMNNVNNPFFAQLARTTQKEALKAGYDVVYYANTNLIEESKAIDMLIGKKVAGVVLVPSQDAGEDKLISRLESAAIPFVYLNRALKQPGADCVLVDNTEGAIRGMEYLFSLGHRLIGFVGASPITSAVSERLDGYNIFMQRNNMSENAFVQISSLQNDAGGHEAAKTMLSSSRRPTAVICANDITAVGVMKAARELKINVPGGLSVVGYDDIELAAHLSPSLTTISQPLEKMAEYALDMLMKKIGGTDNGKTKKMVLPSTLVIRESCRKINK